jgi:hypothetical protein
MLCIYSVFALESAGLMRRWRYAVRIYGVDDEGEHNGVVGDN